MGGGLGSLQDQLAKKLQERTKQTSNPMSTNNTMNSINSMNNLNGASNTSTTSLGLHKTTSKSIEFVFYFFTIKVS